METIRLTPKSVGFDELLESRLRQLLISIRNTSLDELESELTSLHQIIDTYKRNDELLEGLLNPSTPKNTREQIVERLEAQHLRVAQNGAQLELLQAKSHRLLARSVQLLALIDRHVYLALNRTSKYAPEICNYCKGTGGSTGDPCPGCKGNRTVLVYQPPLICPRCKGDGKADPSQMVASKVCIVCRGKGWALALDRV